MTSFNPSVLTAFLRGAGFTVEPDKWNEETPCWNVQYGASTLKGYFWHYEDNDAVLVSLSFDVPRYVASAAGLPDGDDFAGQMCVPRKAAEEASIWPHLLGPVFSRAFSFLDCVQNALNRQEAHLASLKVSGAAPLGAQFGLSSPTEGKAVWVSTTDDDGEDWRLECYHDGTYWHLGLSGRNTGNSEQAALDRVLEAIRSARSGWGGRWCTPPELYILQPPREPK